MKVKVPRNDGQQANSNVRNPKNASASEAAQFADSSARTSDQASLIDSIQNSPRAVAQAAQFKTVFGEAAQLMDTEDETGSQTGAAAMEEDPASYTGSSATDDATSSAAVSATDTTTSSSPSSAIEDDNDSPSAVSATEDDAAGYTGASE